MTLREQREAVYEIASQKGLDTATVDRLLRGEKLVDIQREEAVRREKEAAGYVAYRGGWVLAEPFVKPVLEGPPPDREPERVTMGEYVGLLATDPAKAEKLRKEGRVDSPIPIAQPGTVPKGALQETQAKLSKAEHLLREAKLKDLERQLQEARRKIKELEGTDTEQTFEEAKPPTPEPKTRPEPSQ